MENDEEEEEDDDEEESSSEEEEGTRVFLLVKINNLEPRRMLFRLDDNGAGKIAAQFARLCRGDGAHKLADSLFHRVVPKSHVAGGDVGAPPFAGEKPERKHNARGLLSMAPSVSGSQFVITLAPAPQLDGQHVVFGALVKGKAVLKAVERVGTSDGITNVPVRIVACGVESTPASSETS